MAGRRLAIADGLTQRRCRVPC